MTTKWSHLPNAAYIDAVLASVKAHPQQWTDAWNKIYPNGATPAWYAARGAMWNAAQFVARDAARDAARGAAQFVACDAILALIAYDDCAYLLESEVDELRILAAFGDQRAILLVPACLALSMIKEKAIA